MFPVLVLDIYLLFYISTAAQLETSNLEHRMMCEDWRGSNLFKSLG